jgi:murein DD-endopeptidase MepM/ murein hydrolase activator NlpD
VFQIPATPEHREHRGVDIMYRKKRRIGVANYPWATTSYEMFPNTPALAYAAGMVVSSQPLSTGHQVVIDHGDGLKTGYEHLSRRLVDVGQQVEAGQPIGIIGGSPTGYGLVHLHFDVLKNGFYTDPQPYLVDAVHIRKPRTNVEWLLVGANAVGLAAVSIVLLVILRPSRRLNDDVAHRRAQP